MKKNSVVFLLLLVLALQSFASAGKKEVILRLTEASTYVFDETFVYLDLGSSQFIYSEDGQKVFDDSSSAPMLYSFSSDHISCFSNSNGNLVPATVVPLGVRVAGNGTYMISASLIDNFDPTSVLILEDRTLSAFHDLRQSDYSFAINQATQDEGRFSLHISTPPVITTIIAGCSNNDGVILVDQDTSVRWTSGTLYDNNFSMVASFQNITGKFSFGGLAFGNYNMVFTLSNYTAIKPVQLAGKSVSVEVSASTTHTSVGAPVQFFTTATNTSNYLWDFGDGGQITGVVNPTFSYTQAGVYDASIHCSNIFGCSARADITIIVDEATSVNTVAADNISVTAQNKSLSIRFAQPLQGDISCQIYNAIGEQLISSPLSSNETTIDLSSMPTGIYIVKVKSSHSDFSRKILLQ